MRSRRPLWLVAAVSLALLACGEDERLSRQQFVSRANALCRENDRRISDVGQQVIARARRRRPRPSRAQVTAEVVDRTLPSVRSLIRRLRALRPPEEDEARVDRFIDQVETATNLVREFARAARAGDRAKISELTTRFAEIAGPTRRFAQDYGLRDCLPEAGRT